MQRIGEGINDGNGRIAFPQVRDASNEEENWVF
jgi:hypothetical protein